MELLALWKTMRHAHGSSSENLLQTDSTGTLFQCRLPFPAVLDRKTEFQSVMVLHATLCRRVFSDAQSV